MILFEENHLFFALKLFHVKQFFCGHCLFIQLKNACVLEGQSKNF